MQTNLRKAGAGIVGTKSVKFFNLFISRRPSTCRVTLFIIKSPIEL